MDKLDRYRQMTQKILEHYSQFRPIVGETERFVSFDCQRDHYQLFTVGWNEHQRIYGCLIHIDIRDGKLWIQYDGTEDGVANDLVEMGVPKEDIVLAFHSAYMRQYTEFAVS
jgi:XisI protein